jgi:hypothetical protein
MSRKDYASVFTVILLTTWLAVGVFGDHNTYVVYKDGSLMEPWLPFRFRC